MSPPVALTGCAAPMRVLGAIEATCADIVMNVPADAAFAPAGRDPDDHGHLRRLDALDDVLHRRHEPAGRVQLDDDGLCVRALGLVDARGRCSGRVTGFTCASKVSDVDGVALVDGARAGDGDAGDSKQRRQREPHARPDRAPEAGKDVISASGYQYRMRRRATLRLRLKGGVSFDRMRAVRPCPPRAGSCS